MIYEEGDVVRVAYHSGTRHGWVVETDKGYALCEVTGPTPETTYRTWFPFESLELVRLEIETKPKETITDNLPEGVKGKGNLSSKPHLAYLDPHLEYQMGLGMRYGAGKHGWNNHRKLGVEASLHILDSLKRHLNAYLRGEQIDEESGVHHLACLVNNANFLFRIDRIHGYDNLLDNIYGETQ